MTLTAKQVAQVKAAPPKAKAALTARYHRENKANPPPRKVGRSKAPARRVPMANQIASLAKQGGRPSRIPNYLDPMCPYPVPSVLSDGRALPHTGLISDDFVVHQNRKILLVTNPGNSGTVGVLVEVDSDGSTIGRPVIYTIPTLALADSDGGPTAARSMKLGVTVINCSNALKRGGRITYLNSSQRLPAVAFDPPAAFTGLDKGKYEQLVDGVKSSPYRRRITADDLVEPKQLIAYPVDSISYNSYSAFKGTMGTEELAIPSNYPISAAHTRLHVDLLDYICVHSPGNPEVSPRPMSTIAYIFEPTSEAQDYSFTIRGAYYTRWPLTSVPGQSMQNSPTAPAAHLNQLHNHAEATANDLAHIGMGVAAAHLAPKAGNALRGVVGRMGRMGYRAAAGGIEMAEGSAAATEMGEVAMMAALSPLGI